MRRSRRYPRPPDGQGAAGNVERTITPVGLANDQVTVQLCVRPILDGRGVTAGWRNYRVKGDLQARISQTEVDASRSDGKVIFFFPDGSGGWEGVSDLDVQIAQSGSNWVLTDWNDTVETYSSTGLLLSIRMRNGYTQTLNYVQSAGCGGANLLTSVSDSYGRADLHDHHLRCDHLGNDAGRAGGELYL
jgi:hypothetical protein